MTPKPWYHFARTLTRRVVYFAFPRTGSHFFRYCTQGLFDLVALPHKDLEHAEAVDRQRELNPDALYALDLREDGVPFSPVLFDGQAAGRHGEPFDTGEPTVVLIRHPIAAVYSQWRVAPARWGHRVPADPVAWITDRLDAYARFYEGARRLLENAPERSLLIRYESLVASPEPLEALVRLVGVRPKLSPRFVHAVTRFESFVRPDLERTFYREGTDESWKGDEAWLAHLARARIPDLQRFGYHVEIPERAVG